MKEHHEFRATADRMLDLIEQLRDSEQAKRRVEVGSAEFVDLAIRSERLSRLVFRWAGLQQQMAEASASAVQRGEILKTPLEQVPARRIDEILASWREAQIRFELATPGSPEAAAAANDIERLRVEFLDAQNRAHEGYGD